MRAAVAAAVTLCQRNTQRLDPQESTMLWFRLLDKYVSTFCTRYVMEMKQAEFFLFYFRRHSLQAVVVARRKEF